MLAIQIINLTALESLSALFEGTAGKTDLIATAAGERNALPERILRRVEENPAVQIAAPSLQLPTNLNVRVAESTIPLSLLGFDIGGFMVYGIDPQIDPAVREYTLTEGEFLSGDKDAQEIVLVEDYARDNELEVGKIVELLGADGAEEFEIVGLIAKQGAGQNNNGSFGVIPLETAQKIFNRTGELDQIDILLVSKISTKMQIETAKASLQADLGENVAITSTAAQGERVNQMLTGFSIGLNFMGGMALFVGGYLIFNAFSMTVVERKREFGMLRTLGLSRQQVTGQVLVEAALLGIGGSLVGALLGIGLAAGSARLLARLLEIGSMPVRIDPPIILNSMLVGILVTVIAALIPAWQAGSISPLEALRARGAIREGWLMRKGWRLGLLMLLVSFIILLINPFPYDVQFRLGSITVVLLFFGGTLLIPGSVGVWEKLIRPLMRWVYGAAGQLGSSNIQRGKLRTTLTVAALMVGVSMIVITRGMTDSFRGDLEVWIDAYVGGDLLISSTAPMRSQMQRRLEALPGVATVTPMRTLTAIWQKPDGGTQEISFIGVDPASYIQVTSFVFSDSKTDEEAALQQLSGGNAVFLSSVLAEKYDLQVGDTMRLRTRVGVQDFKIAAIVVSFYNQGLTVQASWQDLRRYFGSSDADAYLVKVAKGYDPASVQQHIEDMYGERQNLSVVSNQALIDQVMTLLNQAYIMFDAMAIIAVLVGVLGIVNTLTMNVVERSQEIGMLRSIGLTRGQTLVMVLAESLMMGLIGGVLGLCFGILLARIFLWSMTAMSGYQISFVVPVGAIIAGLLIAIVVSQLAAILPARRAAYTRILDAIHYE